MQWLQELFDRFGCGVVSVLLGLVGVIVLISFLDRHRSSESQPGDDSKHDDRP